MSNFNFFKGRAVEADKVLSILGHCKQKIVEKTTIMVKSNAEIDYIRWQNCIFLIENYKIVSFEFWVICFAGVLIVEKWVCIFRSVI